MEIFLAPSAGFCFGVNRAVESVYNHLGKDILYTYGPIIHNKEVINDLQSKGVKIIDHVQDINTGTVIIRSHGVSPEVYEALDEKQISYIDSTCPYVKRIHKIVNQNYKEGNPIVIVGDPQHPEIQGINGWCNYQAYIVENEEQAKKINISMEKPICVVAQTTYQQDQYYAIISIFQEQGYSINVHETICSATSVRQKAAFELSKQVDKMIIIGDRYSSNTQKLYEICKKHCNNTFYIETIHDLQLNIFKTNDKIGITAGASTPAAIIKEVVCKMSELDNNNENGMSFEEMLDQSLVTLHTGGIVKGIVIHVTNDEVSVNLGYKSDGIIPKSELSNDPNVNPSDIVKIGDEIEVYVVRVNDGDGNVLLSKKKVDSQKGWDIIELAHKANQPVIGRIVEVVKGGVIAVSSEMRVFIPSSQLSNRYVEDLKSFLGKEVSVKIIEFDKTKRRIIGSRKELAEKEMNEKKTQLFASIAPGQKVIGTVSRIADFGAFVDLNGVDGLIHISEMSWGRIANPKKLLKEGQTVEVLVLDVDQEKGKISLSLKNPEQNPWNTIVEKYPVGTIVEGKVVRMVPFGAFVELEEGVDGLIHISQISEKHVVKPEDELNIGDIVKVKVLDINVDNRKISLSKKEAEGVEVEVEAAVEE